MPPKKSKTTSSQEEEKIIDVVSCLDEVGSCLDRARDSMRACLNGIAKADIALRESKGDSDIQCVALIKRAELIFIAVKNNYNLDSLQGDRQKYSLDSCIADCERVLSEVSSEDHAGKQLCETARAICTNAQKLKQEMEYEENKASKSNSKKDPASPKGVFKRYDPAKTSFKNIDKINPFLLQDVVDCYGQYKTVCRMCYYRKHTQEPISSSGHCRGCKKVAQPLAMIPASKMCDNLSGMKVIPIHPPPKMMLTSSYKHKPFQICKNQDHQLCRDKAAVGENWFAHSIEELVIWTIERHYGCKFQKYIDKHHSPTQGPDHALFESSQEVTQHSYYTSEDGDTDDLFSDSYSETFETDNDEHFEYYPEDAMFHDIASIPKNLLLDIVKQYKSAKEYCKWCYYKREDQGVASLDRRANLNMCSICRSNWQAVMVIPASELCWNFGDFEFLPIAPWPRGKPNKDPFEYCRKQDHHRCFRVYIDSEFWYPHSVEEMVIWTVEREKQCTFSHFISSMSRIPSTSANHTQRPASNSKVEEKKHPNDAYGIQQSSQPLPPPPPPPSSMVNRPVPISSKPNLSSDAKWIGSKPTNGPHNPPGKPLTNGRFATFIPPADLRHFGPPMPGGGGGNANSGPMMYLSQPPGHMYPPPGQPLLFTPPIGIQQGHPPPPPPGPLLPHPNLGPPQPMPYHPGAKPPPPHMMAMNPQSMYNPMFINPPNFNPQMFPSSVAASTVMTRNSIPVMYDNVPESSRESERVGNSGRSVVNTVPSKANKSSGALDSKAVSISASSVSVTISNSNDGGLSKVTPGRKNYKVAPSPGGRSESSTASGGSQAVEVKAASKTPILATRVNETTPLIFKFSEVKFKDFFDIPVALLKSVALCFRDKMTVCRKCFYGERNLNKRRAEAKFCNFGEHEWIKPILVIPGCSMCDNEPSFQKGEHVPILPLPPVAVLKKCSSRNHHKCFSKCLQQDVWQAHSVEELVVWFTESEKDCPFEEYIQELDSEKSSSVFSPVSSPDPVPVLDEVTRIDTTATTTTTTTTTNISRATSTSAHIPKLSPAPAATAAVKSPSKPVNTREVSPSVTKKQPMAKTKKYNPKDVEFKDIKDIPHDLLCSVAECFDQLQLVCRICFFESNCVLLVKKNKKTTGCDKDHIPWKPIRVIPKSPLCMHMSSIHYNRIPIPPLPKHMRQTSTPFVVCKKNNHSSCFAMSRGTNPWFPHTAEELVIWTVERETAKAFEDVYKRYLPQALQTPSTKQSSKSTSIPERPVSPTTTHPPASELKVSSAPPLARELKVSPTTAPPPARELKVNTSGASVAVNYNSTVVGSPRGSDSWQDTSDLLLQGSTPELSGSSNEVFLSPTSDISADPDDLRDKNKGNPNIYPQFLVPHAMFDNPFSSNVPPPPNEIATNNSSSDLISLSFSGITSLPRGYEKDFSGVNPGGVGVSSTYYPSLLSDQKTKPEQSQSQSQWKKGDERMKSESSGWSGGDQQVSDFWSRAVGDKKVSVEYLFDESPLDNPALPMHNLVGDDEEFSPLRPSHEFLHQSQVDNDVFQPYTIQPPAKKSILRGTNRSKNNNSTSETASRKKLTENGVNVLEDSFPGGKVVASSGGNSIAPNDGRLQWSPSPLNATRDVFASSSNEKLMESSVYGLVGNQTAVREASSSNARSNMMMTSAVAAAAASGRDTEVGVVADDLKTGANINHGNEENVFPDGFDRATRHSNLKSPPLRERDSASTNASKRVETGGGFHCLLCYDTCETGEELASHCSSDLEHLERVIFDSGASKIWRFPPPPPQEPKTSVPICTSLSCGGAPFCTRPHSKKEKLEWIERWKHREIRKREGRLRLIKSSPRTDIRNEKNLLHISEIKDLITATVSEPYRKADNVCWDLTIKGENWLSLFGVATSSKCSWGLKITRIEETTTPSHSIFHPHSSSWTAPLVHGRSVKQCLLLGSVELTVKAIPPRNKAEADISAEVRLDLGHKEYVFIEVKRTSIKGDNGRNVQVEKDDSSWDKFVPRQQWDLSTHSSSSSDDLGDLNIEGEDLTLQHVPIEDWGYSLTDDQPPINGTGVPWK